MIFKFKKFWRAKAMELYCTSDLISNNHPKIAKNLYLQSGPKVLDHWGVITNDFPRSPFSMLIHIVLARTPLLSATLKQGVGRGNCIWIQGLGVTIPLKNRQKFNVSTVNGWMKLKRERRSNDFWPWLSERVSKYCI